jgi:hypothetical protein
MIKNKVEFIPKNKQVELLVPRPKPANNYLPQWFKEMPAMIPDLDNKKMDETAKRCMPFVDSLTSGYIQELPCDISISYDGFDEESKNHKISYNWSGEVRPLSTRAEEMRSRNVFNGFAGYYNAEFHWNSLWEPKTPKGYSTLYYHPSNRVDLPFTTLSGIIDTDRWSSHGPVPFLIKEGFSGIIPAGTPMYQMIFIKRDGWQSNFANYDEEKQKVLDYKVRRFFMGGYKKQHWQRKEYL